MPVNVIAVLVAAVSGFVLGGLWYGPLFGKLWAREVGEIGKGNMALVFGGVFVMNLIASLVFAMFLGPHPSLKLGLDAGFACGAGWVATSFATNYLFARRSWKLFAIDGGYVTGQFTLIGLVIALLP